MKKNKYIIYEDTWSSLGYSCENPRDIKYVDLNDEFEKENKKGWYAIQITHKMEEYAMRPNRGKIKNVFYVLYEKTED